MACTQPTLDWDGLWELRIPLRGYLARRCRDDNEIDDLLQETLLRAARYRGALEPTRLLRPWLLRIAGNVLHDHVRRENRIVREEGADEIFEQLEGRESIPGDLEPGERVTIEGQPLPLVAALDELECAVVGLGVAEQDALRRYYGGAQMCCESVGTELREARFETAPSDEEPQCDDGEDRPEPSWRAKTLLFRARLRLRAQMLRRLNALAATERAAALGMCWAHREGAWCASTEFHDAGAAGALDG